MTPRGRYARGSQVTNQPVLIGAIQGAEDLAGASV